MDVVSRNPIPPEYQTVMTSNHERTYLTNFKQLTKEIVLMALSITNTSFAAAKNESRS